MSETSEATEQTAEASEQTSEAMEQTAEATEQTAGYMERPPETRINPAPKENPSHWMKPAKDLY